MDYSDLCQTALESRKKAYSPYSNFSVGAALLSADGKIYEGANVENSAFTPSNCAERTAFFTAIYDGARDFSAIAVVGAERKINSPTEFCPPCGVCLQVMSEFCNPETFDIVLVKFNENGEMQIVVRKLKEFLPFGFKL